MFSSFSHCQNAFIPRSSKLCGSLTVFRFSQCANAPDILVTLFGMAMFSILLNSKALSSIDVTVSGIIILFILESIMRNIPPGMTFRPFANLTSVSPVQPSNG